jgi:hypothetical protein
MLLRINGRLEVNCCAICSEFRLKPFCCTAILHFLGLIAAVAELLDNAVDEVIHCALAHYHSGLNIRLSYICMKQIQTGGSTRIKVDKVIDHRNGSPALLVQGFDY